jgi:hypothetical protein
MTLENTAFSSAFQLGNREEITEIIPAKRITGQFSRRLLVLIHKTQTVLSHGRPGAFAGGCHGNRIEPE